VRPAEIEAWARDVLDRVGRHQPIEDARVEVKGTWVDPVRAARRLAAHANAARGANLLWLIGVDEVQGIVGADRVELSDWHAKVHSEFDELSPDMMPLNVPTPTGTVVALFFETDRAPYAVRNPQGGAVQIEVPWRDGNSTRSAHRSELLRLLVPLENLPVLELTTVRLDIGDVKAIMGAEVQAEQSVGWVLDAYIYVVPKTKDRIVIPLHRSRLSVHFEDSSLVLQSGNFSFGMRQEPLITVTQNQAVVDGPGFVDVLAHERGLQAIEIPRGRAEIRIDFALAGSDHRAVVQAELQKEQLAAHRNIDRWILPQSVAASG
jgi:hypothetical protein